MGKIRVACFSLTFFLVHAVLSVAISLHYPNVKQIASSEKTTTAQSFVHVKKVYLVITHHKLLRYLHF